YCFRYIGFHLIIIMKNIFILLAFICFSCVTHKSEELERENKKQKLVESKKIKVQLPKDWVY
ncbi:MAG: hypothetical protein L0J60_09360, partial [Psychroflexus sp.]|nr:hypothetical protein [Psychroflexus sp.]